MINDDVHLRRLIHVTVFLMTVLGTLAFSLGRGSVALPACSVAAGALAYWVSRSQPQFHLHRVVINLVIFTIAVAMAARLVKARASLEYASLADGFVFLQCALLFEQRTARTWWDLMTLSFALLFVGGQLVQGPSFGLVMLVYFFCALAALAGMQIYRQRTQWRAEERQETGQDELREAAPAVKTNWWRVAKVAGCTFLVGPFSLFMRFRDTTLEPKLSGDQPTAGQAETSGGRRHGLPAGLGRSRLDSSPEFWRLMLHSTAVSVAVACVMFVVTPRFGRFEFNLAEFRRIVWGEEEDPSTRTVGYRDKVELGELGAALESPAKALTVELADYSGQRAKIDGDIYLRGAVLTLYREGFWEHRRYSSLASHPDLRRDATLPTAGLVRQRVTMEPMDHTGIFSVWSPVYTDQTDDIWFDEHDERFRRPRDRRKKEFKYELGTSGFVDGRQVRLTPCEAPVYTQALVQFPDYEFPALLQLGQQWMEESGIPPDDSVARAEYLSKRFSGSTKFAYTLGEQPRDTRMDPVEDFIANNPYGNCEYFATALALMLRSQGIPSRVVVGYRSDELGYFDQGYIVRQEHAHSWVEAYIPPDQCQRVPDRVQTLADWTHGGWLRLDPTPASSGMIAGLLGRGVEDWVVRLRSFWANRIVGMTSRQHRDIVYGSVIGSLKGIAKKIFDPAWWNALSRGTNIPNDPTAVRHLGTDVSALWFGSLVGVSLILAIVYAVWRLGILRWIHRPAALPRPTVDQRRVAAVEVPFYRQLELLLERFGFRREAQQTPREFSQQIAAQLVESTGDPSAKQWLVDIAEAYYRVRYGRLELNGTEAASIQIALKRLENSAAALG